MVSPILISHVKSHRQKAITIRGSLYCLVFVNSSNLLQLEIMNPEREFLLNILSRFLEENPDKAAEQAFDICEKYLQQQQKSTLLEEHAALLEEKIEEMTLDYRILRIELRVEQRKNKNISPKTSHSYAELPNFLPSAPRKYFCEYIGSKLMPTNKPKISIYAPQHIYERFW